MSVQLTSLRACQRKHTYRTYNSAKSARKRRNKAAGFNYLRAYKCDKCSLWHVTSQDKV